MSISVYVFAANSPLETRFQAIANGTGLNLTFRLEILQCLNGYSDL